MADDGIQFTVKEMLAQIDGKIDKLSSDLASKASVADVMDLRSRLADLDAKALKRDGPVAATIRANTERLTAVERTIDINASDIGNIPDKADKEYVNGLRGELHEVSSKLDSVQRRLVTFAFSVALSSVGLALTLVLTLGGKP